MSINRLSARSLDRTPPSQELSSAVPAARRTRISRSRYWTANAAFVRGGEIAARNCHQPAPVSPSHAAAASAHPRRLGRHWLDPVRLRLQIMSERFKALVVGPTATPLVTGCCTGRMGGCGPLDLNPALGFPFRAKDARKRMSLGPLRPAPWSSDGCEPIPGGGPSKHLFRAYAAWDTGAFTFKPATPPASVRSPGSTCWQQASTMWTWGSPCGWRPDNTCRNPLAGLFGSQGSGCPICNQNPC